MIINKMNNILLLLSMTICTISFYHFLENKIKQLKWKWRTAAKAAAASILPIKTTMANLGIPLTGSTAMGFTLGILSTNLKCIKYWEYN